MERTIATLTIISTPTGPAQPATAQRQRRQTAQPPAREQPRPPEARPEPQQVPPARRLEPAAPERRAAPPGPAVRRQVCPPTNRPPLAAYNPLAPLPTQPADKLAAHHLAQVPRPRSLATTRPPH